jgi:hypothetical protein
MKNNQPSILPTDEKQREDFINDLLRIYSNEGHSPDLYEVKSGSVFLMFIVSGNLTTKLAYRLYYGMFNDARQLTESKEVLGVMINN